MLIVREVLHCKPGKVRPMIDKFKAMKALRTEMGIPTYRITTDVSGDHYWTMSAEVEVPTLADYFGLEEKVMANPKAQEIMTGYHELMIQGRREIAKIEA